MKLGTLFNWQTRQTRCFVRYCSTPPPPQNESQARLRREFLRLEEELERKVDYARLDPAERLIHQTHKEAVEGLHFTYRDPESGLLVVTRLRHFLKGSCCGNACRQDDLNSLDRENGLKQLGISFKIGLISERNICGFSKH